jgi:predicted O-linked N-acetylglucosamine transferase (SPINDLY family)
MCRVGLTEFRFLKAEQQATVIDDSAGGAANPAVEANKGDPAQKTHPGVIEAERFMAAGDLQAAYRQIKATIDERLENPEALLVLGKVLAAAGHLEDAEAAFRACLELDPTRVASWLGLGLLCRERRMTGEAMRCFGQAVQLRPDDPFLRSNLAVTLGDSGRISESIQQFEAALELDARAMTAHSNLLLMLHYDPSGTPERLSREHRRWAAQHAPAVSATVEGQRWSGSGPIRIGFLSGDFRGHPVGRLLAALWPHWGADEVSIYAYETGGPADGVTGVLRKRSKVWRRIDGLDDAAAADLIRGDQIHVLIDLSGHTAGHRLGVLVQCL